MKSIFVFLTSAMCLIAFTTEARADIMCFGDRGYQVFLYPGARPTGSRFPAGELRGPDEQEDFMICNEEYTVCHGPKYDFERSAWDRKGRFRSKEEVCHRDPFLGRVCGPKYAGLLECDK